MGLRAEIAEQPAVLARLLASRRREVEAIAHELARTPPAFALIAARGSSDHAARYANYLWGIKNQLPVALATPALFTTYRAPPALAHCIVVGISQSGESPDITGVLVEAARQGAPTLAITNAETSPLARAARLVLPLDAGEERAVAATKTYTAELLAVAMLAAAWRADAAMWRELEHVPEALDQVLRDDASPAAAAQRLRSMDRCVVLGRGYNYASSFELALKLKELTYVIAEPYSPADFLHGPVAVVERALPVCCIAPSGVVLDDMRALAQKVKGEREAELVIIADDAQLLALADAPLPLAARVEEWASPLLAIAPGQLLAYHLARAKGLDPERPRGLAKVTRTL